MPRGGLNGAFGRAARCVSAAATAGTTRAAGAATRMTAAGAISVRASVVVLVLVRSLVLVVVAVVMVKEREDSAPGAVFTGESRGGQRYSN